MLDHIIVVNKFSFPLPGCPQIIVFPESVKFKFKIFCNCDWGTSYSPITGFIKYGVGL